VISLTIPSRFVRAAIAIVVLPALLLLPASPGITPVQAQDGICERDIEFTTAIDVEQSEAMVPAMAVWLKNFSFPGTSREFWGNGEYAAVNIDRSTGRSRESHLSRPRYDAPGTYTLEITGTDNCPRPFTIERELTVPLRLPIDNIIECPGQVDQSACLVPRDEEVTFAVSGPDGDVDWIWTGLSEEVIGPELTAAFTPGEVAVIQGTYLAEDGDWVVTPYMQVLGVETSRPEIVSFTDPGTVPLGEPVLLEFAAPVTGDPAITVNGEAVTQTTSIEYVFEEAGPQIINYVLARENAPPLIREIVVHVEAPGNFLITMLVAAAGVLTLLVVALIIWWLRISRRQRTRRQRREVQRARAEARRTYQQYDADGNDIDEDGIGTSSHPDTNNDTTVRRN
jgi:hypothetical protein